jgi:hypothetical protein
MLALREAGHERAPKVTNTFALYSTCAWCLTSAALMMALLLLTVTPRRLALIKGAAI